LAMISFRLFRRGRGWDGCLEGGVRVGGSRPRRSIQREQASTDAPEARVLWTPTRSEPHNSQIPTERPGQSYDIISSWEKCESK